MKSRLELFVADPRASAEFYEETLGFERVAEKDEGRYVSVRSGDVRLAFLSLSWFLSGLRLGLLRYFRLPPIGVEIVLEVEDVEAARERVERARPGAATPIVDQPWGLRDFRLQDPDGHYLRVTTA